MKTSISFLFFVIIFTSYLFAQSVDSLTVEIQSLEQRDENIDQQIDSLQSVKEEIRLAILKKSELIKTIKLGNLGDVSGEGIPTRIKSDIAYLKLEPSIMSSTIEKLSPDDEVLIYDWFEEPYFKASYEGQFGYITHTSLEANEFVQSVKDKIKNEKLEELRKESPRLAELTQRFGEENARKIMDGSIWIGMTKPMAYQSIGAPEDISSSTYEWGEFEQWVYADGRYLYFEDGRLSSWQN